MHPTAELIGAAAALVVLGILTLASVRSIGRRREAPPGEHEEDVAMTRHHRRFSSVLAPQQ
ncbi:MULTISPECIES: hypothetical protein [unclassified Streptomyces]|uniref:hypothetical protein n=1 Tax=unclassified Streptomyces TaxID=2593676 RepID=UPI0004C03235|nr:MULTISPECIES: hypothetical protein [unclassified Streptomyces]